jgi:hypothetical protein
MICEHILADENGLCITCGLPATDDAPRISPQEQALLAEVSIDSIIALRIPHKADLPGICRLADLAIEEYAEELDTQRDLNSAEPKLRMIGKTIHRPTWEDIWNRISMKSYVGAVMLGYRQPISRWDNFLRETVIQGILRNSGLE